jgi:hypothetical protein
LGSNIGNKKIEKNCEKGNKEYARKEKRAEPQ